MKTKAFGNRLIGFASALMLAVAGTLWWAGDGRAAPDPAAGAAAGTPQTVQDKAPDLDLDTKIFLHRNGRIVTAAPLPLRA